jgi:hypothetical protein
MKLNRILASGGALAILAVNAHATDARIESMGKNSNFVMDDISIYDNPANIGIYPNYLIGEMGSYTDADVTSGGNTDPQQPYFGGIFSIGLGEESGRDPRFLIGGALNREDDLHEFLPDFVILPKENRVSQDTVIQVPETSTNFDGFLGFSSKDGNLFGLHLYVAMQDGAVKTDNGYVVNNRAYAAVMSADAGVNFQFNEDVDWEISGGLSRVDFGDSEDSFLEASALGFWGKTRMFSTFDLINGEFIPHGEIRYTIADGREHTLLNIGAGVNVAMDRGFFWLGVEYFETSDETAGWSKADDGTITVNQSDRTSGKDVRNETGAVISFGIERNIWWDWFVVRVGGKKVISYVECNLPEGAASDDAGFCGEEGNYMNTNNYGDGTEGDHVGFGFGINVEEQLKIDVTVAEDVLYRNPFQGSGRLFSRISATYAF